MGPLRIRTYGAPVLKEKAAEVETVDAELRELAAAMAEMMYGAKGIGLAAPQVGVSKRLIVVDVDWIRREGDDEDGGEEKLPPPRRLRVYINPEIVWESDEDGAMSEGCLSVPGVEGDVYRALSVKFRYQDLRGVQAEEQADGLLARCLQHEIDHLDGILFVDRMPFLRRARLAGTLGRLRRQNAA
jgi:peptide deformylase